MFLILIILTTFCIVSPNSVTKESKDPAQCRKKTKSSPRLGCRRQKNRDYEKFKKEMIRLRIILVKRLLTKSSLTAKNLKYIDKVSEDLTNPKPKPTPTKNKKAQKQKQIRTTSNNVDIKNPTVRLAENVHGNLKPSKNNQVLPKMQSTPISTPRAEFSYQHKQQRANNNNTPKILSTLAAIKPYL